MEAAGRGQSGDEGKTGIDEVMCTRELGNPFRRDARSKPFRLLEKYKDHV